MQDGPISHADRVAATLANVEAVRKGRPAGPAAAPGAGARDCRIDLKLLQWRAIAAGERSARARDRLADFDPARRPDLWAGTVQDGTARGFATALEEAISLAPPPPAVPIAIDDPVRSQRFDRKQLRRKKDLLVKSGGSRVRFSRREGLLFVDRGEQVHSTNCLRFEARRDVGTLDGFRGDDGERPRMFSAQFLQPIDYEIAPGYTRLELEGRLGRGPVGWPMRLSLVGVAAEDSVRLVLQVDNAMRDWRLRARFLGIPSAAIGHECADVREEVANDAGGFLAFTLVRACGTLLVDDVPVAVPGAHCAGTHVHCFRLGQTP